MKTGIRIAPKISQESFNWLYYNQTESFGQIIDRLIQQDINRHDLFDAADTLANLATPIYNGNDTQPVEYIVGVDEFRALVEIIDEIVS